MGMANGFRSHFEVEHMPSLGMLTVNALTAADSVLIPVQAQYLPAKGMEQLLQTIAKVRRQLNPALKIDGILLTMVDNRTNYAREISALLRDTYGSKIKVFGSDVPHSVRAAEISAEGKSIFAHDRKGKVAAAYERISEAGYPCYDFFLPGLIIDAFERRQGGTLCNWARELWDKKIQSVNMLGCHDGIPLLDLKGILPDEQITALIETVVKRGGLLKDLHGQKNVYYQVNATYYSALGEDDRLLLLARAIQLFMPGKPQVWYLDLFAGRNDIQATKTGGSGGHKEINRTNLTRETIEAGMKKQIVKDQLNLLRFRNRFLAFGLGAEFETNCTEPEKIFFAWRKKGYSAELVGSLETHPFSVIGRNRDGHVEYQFIQQ